MLNTRRCRVNESLYSPSFDQVTSRPTKAVHRSLDDAMLRMVYHLGHASDACCTNVHTRSDVSKLRLIAPPNSCSVSSHPAAICSYFINTSIFRNDLFTAPLLSGILGLENDIASCAWIAPGTAANFSFISCQAVISVGPPSTVLHRAYVGRHILGISPGGEEQK